MYTKLKDTDTIYFDVDDTLIMWISNPPEEIIDQVELIKDSSPAFPNYVVAVIPHKYHIEQLKKNKQKGNMIVVWSQGGSDWAETVVRHLKLEEYVDIIVNKPHEYYDDLEPEYWLPSRKYKVQQ